MQMRIFNRKLIIALGIFTIFLINVFFLFHPRILNKTTFDLFYNDSDALISLQGGLYQNMDDNTGIDTFKSSVASSNPIVGSHQIEAVLYQARIINDHDGFLAGDGEWTFHLYHSIDDSSYRFSSGVYSGEYSAYRQRKHGTSSKDIPAHRLVVFAQNHDQVGNRARGDRLSQITSFEGLKLAAGTVLLSPFIPLLFMGEE